MSEKKIRSETKKQYEEDAKKYFGYYSAAKGTGKSAEDFAQVEARLPGPEHKQRLLERYTKGFGKTSRSGAFSKPGIGPAIFPNGLKFAQDFIDEMTPKGIKQKEQPKPDISKEAKPTGFFPKACAVITEVCLDCLKELDVNEDWILGMYIVTDEDALKLWAMHVYNGGLVNYAICRKCYDKALDASQEKTPLLLVANGSLVEEHIDKGEMDAEAIHQMKDLQRRGSALPLHTGNERTLGQVNMLKRMEKLKTNLSNYLISLPPDSKVFKHVEQRSQDGHGYDRDTTTIS
jgi:hypothetical protein